MRNAKRGKLAGICASIAYPTTARECTSNVTAKYNQPSLVGRYVMSDTHTWFGCGMSNFRSRTFGATIGSCRLSVVRTNRRFPLATKPLERIKRATRFRDTRQPWAFKSACTLGAS